MSLNQTKHAQVPFVKTSLVDVTKRLPFKPPCKIFFKNEYEQPSGSFKLRGISHLIGTKVEEIRAKSLGTKIHVFVSSGGNAGLAAAYSAQFYGIECTVCVPSHTKQVIISKLETYNAHVLIFGNSINEADGYLRSQMILLNDSIEKIYCHPFEHELIWEGHSSLVDEICASNLPQDKLKGIVCSIGGGGLYNGILMGLKANKVKADVLLVETTQAPTFAETIKKKKIFTLDSVKSLATSLACSYLSKQSLDNYLHQDDNNRTKFQSIDDIDAARAVLDYHDVFHHLIEPACGAAVCVCLSRMDLLFKNFPDLHEDDIIVVVVCGGSCTDKDGLEELKQIVNRSKL